MPSELESRFLRFMASLPGTESLDALLRDPMYDGQRRADYLLFERRVILELKSLETDTTPKVDAEIDQHRRRDDFPLFFGEVELQKVLKHLPDGKKINERIYHKTTRSIEDAVRSAEDQIDNTAKLLGLPEAAGILVVLNQDLTIFTPEVLAHKVATLMRRKSKDGAPRSPLAYSWLILESHFVANCPSGQAFPVISVEGPRFKQMPWLSGLIGYLQVAWAQFNGSPLLEHHSQALDTLDAKPRSTKPSPLSGDRVSKQVLWEIRYKEAPHLRNLSDSQVLEHGRKTFATLAPHFLVGGPEVPSEQMELMLIAWSDFLCEARYRGLDLRKMRDA